MKIPLILNANFYWLKPGLEWFSNAPFTLQTRSPCQSRLINPAQFVFFTVYPFISCQAENFFGRARMFFSSCRIDTRQLWLKRKTLLQLPLECPGHENQAPIQWTPVNLYPNQHKCLDLLNQPWAIDVNLLSPSPLILCVHGFWNHICCNYFCCLYKGL